MAEPTPDYTIANNPHVLMHCGDVGSDADGETNQRDLTFVTSAGCQTIYGKSGNKVQHIQGYSGEVVGHALDPTQKDGVAKAIVAKAGDIVLIAESGNIRMKAKNIYIETSGEEGEGNFMVAANGELRLATGGEFRVAAGRMCFICEGNMNFIGNMVISGSLNKGGALGSASFIQSLMSGNWGSVIMAAKDSCK
jgi:hypothetical protein